MTWRSAFESPLNKPDPPVSKTHCIDFPPKKYPAECRANTTRLVLTNPRALPMRQLVTPTKAAEPSSEPSHSPGPKCKANQAMHQATAYERKAGIKTL